MQSFPWSQNSIHVSSGIWGIVKSVLLKCNEHVRDDAENGVLQNIREALPRSRAFIFVLFQYIFVFFKREDHIGIER